MSVSLLHLSSGIPNHSYNQTLDNSRLYNNDLDISSIPVPTNSNIQLQL